MTRLDRAKQRGPNKCPLHDFNECEGLRWGFLSMEYRIMCPRKDQLGKVLGFPSFRSRNASFDGSFNPKLIFRISFDTTKRRLLSMNGFYPWHFIIVGIELKGLFKSSVNNKKRKAFNGRTISDPWRHCINLFSTC